MKAAAASGADAVYFGVDAFNARQRAENFRLQDLSEVMQWLHQRGVKGFLTFNVLVFSDELEPAAQLLIAACLLYTSPSPRDLSTSRMPSSA